MKWKAHVRGVFLIPERVGNDRLVAVHYLKNVQTFILQGRCFISPIKVDFIPEKDTLWKK